MHGEVQVRANIRNFGDVPYPELRLYFKVDGKEVSASQIRLGAHEKGQALFSHAFDSPGSHVVEVVADADALKADNSFLASIPVRDKVPGAIKLADASAYYPQAAIIGGWAAANDYYEPNKETLAKLIKAWAEANDYIIENSKDAMEALQKNHYSQTPLADINEQFKAQKMFTSRDWKRLYSDGTVVNWLQQSTDFFMANAGIKDFTPASKYFDPSLYLKTIT